MEVPDSLKDPQYVEKKRKELQIFFEDSKLPKKMIEKATENELKPLTMSLNKPYIAASHPGKVKTEQEVMSGQPFTKIDDHNKPLTLEETKEMLKDNPIIAEKARQIQIMSQNEGLNTQVAIPLNEINVTGYNDMRKELDAAKGDQEQTNKIHYKNMLSLMNSVSEYKAKFAQECVESSSERNGPDSSDSDEKDYDAIEKVVSQYTTKSYETRYQETKDMLGKMADNYDEAESSRDPKVKRTIEIGKNPILKESSVQLIKGQKRHSAFEEVKEKYAINAAMNIPLVDNPVTPDLSGKCKRIPDKPKQEEDENIEAEEVFPETLTAKLKNTEKTLRAINSVLNNVIPAPPTLNNTSHNSNTKSSYPDEHKIDVKEIPSETVHKNELQKFDEESEQTLQNTLENIFVATSMGKSENNEMEVKEMKNLARNIVEGAENLSTLIREDITNKLNSMNELLNDVNEALENSRKSNIAFDKIKEEGEILRRGINIEGKAKKVQEERKVTDEAEEKPTDVVSDPQMDSIHDAIQKLNSEIRHHEDRINQSKARYEQRNDECKSFINEVDEILLKSRDILHPMKKNMEEAGKNNKEEECASTNKSTEEKKSAIKSQQVDENGKKIRKELRDVDFSYQNEKQNETVKLQKKQEHERSQRICNLLHDVKDKMKDNKDVLRLANNMLRREENKKKTLADKSGKNCEVSEEIDTRAQGDHIEAGESESTSCKQVSTLTDEKHEGNKIETYSLQIIQSMSYTEFNGKGMV